MTSDSAVTIRTSSGGVATVGDAEVRALAARMRGPLLRPGDAAYDPARRVFNGLFDRRPALIARCAGTRDVVEAVGLARRHRLLTAIRGGGHSVAGHSTCDAGLVVDVSAMNAVHVDEARRVVRVGGGALWGDVDRATQPFGLATPGGIVSHTGVAGLTLGGGIGWLRNAFGLSCDNLVSAEIVTAEGDVLTVSAQDHPDLFWALRGGGGNFGVVTAFELALHPVGPHVAVVFAFYPLAAARRVLAAWRAWVASAPDAAATEVVTWTAPAAPHLPPAVHDRDVVIAAGVYAGDADEGLRVLQSLATFEQPLAVLSTAMPYVQVQQAFDAVLPNTGEVLAYWKSLSLRELSDEAIAIMAGRAEHRSSRSTMVFVQHLGVAIRRVPAEATAFGPRDAAFVINVMGDWRDPRDTDRHVAWVRDAWARLAPQSTGAAYVNYLGADDGETPGLVRSSFGRNYDRLAAIKARYDPVNLFRLNPNIAPAIR